MKNVWTMVLFVIGLQMTAQTENDIQTTVLKAEHLITFAADNFPSEEPQQVYLLIETGKAGIATDDRFYIEQGLKLLLKRLDQEDKIAIGTYGAVNAAVLPFTEVSDKIIIDSGIANLFKGNFKQEPKDGIAMAYDLTEQNYNEEMTSNVLMLRGTGQKIVAEKSTELVSAYQQVSLSQKDPVAVATKKGAVSEKEEKKEERAQRKQARAAEHKSLGGAIALTALTLLPEILDVIKD